MRITDHEADLDSLTLEHRPDGLSRIFGKQVQTHVPEARRSRCCIVYYNPTFLDGLNEYRRF